MVSTATGKPGLFSIPHWWVYGGLLAPQICAALFNDVLSPLGGITYPPFCIMEGCCGIVLALFASCRKKMNERALSLWSAALCALALAASALVGDAAAPLSVLAVSLLGGAGVVCGYAFWFSVCCLLKPRRAVGTLLAVFIITGLLRFIFPFMPLVAKIALAFLVLGVATAASGRFLGGGFERAHRERATLIHKPFSTYAPLLVELALLSTMLGFMSGFFPLWETSFLRFGLRLACAVVLFVFYYVLGNYIDSLKLTQVALLVVISGPLSTVFLELHTDIFITTAICLLQILLFVVFLEQALFDGRSPLCFIGTAWGIYTLGMGAGRLLSLLQPTGEFTLQIALILVCLLTVVSVFVLTSYQERRYYATPRHEELDTNRALEGTIAGTSEDIAASIPKGACADCTAITFEHLSEDAPVPPREAALDLATVFGLTARESEIMELIAKGRSKKYIASDLFISENTVRMHAKNVYAKLGVHSRQELISLVEEYAPSSND